MPFALLFWLCIGKSGLMIDLRSFSVICQPAILCFSNLVHAPFCRGYLLTQVLGGVWADKFGGKRVLSFGVIWWSMATALTPLAASLGLPVLLVMRACMGVGEGVAMPAMNNLLSR